MKIKGYKELADLTQSAKLFSEKFDEFEKDVRRKKK